MDAAALPTEYRGYQVIVKSSGSAGTCDPLDALATVGLKGMHDGRLIGDYATVSDVAPEVVEQCCRFLARGLDFHKELHTRLKDFTEAQRMRLWRRWSRTRFM